MPSLRLLLAVRELRDAEVEERLASEAARAVELLGNGARATGLVRIDPDPFDGQYAAPRKYEAVLAVDAPNTTTRDALIDVARGANERWGDLVQPDLSGALVGELRRIKGSDGPMRLMYLMRHKAGQNITSFQAHWSGPHAEFGVRTQGITAYDQFHPDRTASRAAAMVAGFGIYLVDGVPELHMNSIEEFVARALNSEVGAAAIEDEKSFVDARNSAGFVLRAVTHSPARH